METIRVNMTPCEDIKTIHASQNDNEAREWGFELHNNGEKIDSSSISDQMVFKAYKGGTEEILPTNGSTPTTSPFNGDIKYPQGLLSDQEFLYRESPTESDGLAKITDIKGNTLVWNQLSPSKAFSSSYTKTGLTFVPNDDGSVSISGTVNGTDYNFYVGGIVPVIQGHKYLVKGNSAHFGASYYSPLVAINEYNTGGVIATASATGNAVLYIRGNLTNGASINETIYPQIFDLTQMGLDISSPSDFTSLFPLSYYSYNQGSLLSFNGTGIKTTGKNLYVGSPSFDDFVDRDTYTLADETYNGHEVIYKSEAWHGVYKNILVKANVTYTFSSMVKCSAPTIIRIYNKNADILEWKTIGTEWTRISATFTPSQDTVERLRVESNNTNTVYLSEYQLELGSSASEYEPYAENTLSLPISTYFTNGMKSAGSVYDELTESKAITRIGSVDLGSLNWIHRTEIGQGIFSCEVTSTVLYKRQPSVNFEVAQYNNGGTVTGVVAMVEEPDKTVCVYHTGNTNSRFIYAKNTAYSDATAFKNAMSGIQLYFELSTYEETSFTTASLVTENAEIPLSNNDGTLIGKCTEQLSENPGFFDAKIKLSDADGECYSNKIQLHVERKPS